MSSPCGTGSDPVCGFHRPADRPARVVFPRIIDCESGPSGGVRMVRTIEDGRRPDSPGALCAMSVEDGTGRRRNTLTFFQSDSGGIP